VHPAYTSRTEEVTAALRGPNQMENDRETCPACGRANPAGFKFCGNCGAPLERTCPSCGATNPPAFRFCGTCGSSLDATPPLATDSHEVEERKLVTVMFADLTGSTELATSMDAEDLRAVLTGFFEPMADEIRRHGGTVEKFAGDAVMAVFGAPAAHEDDPERAVRAALAMHRRLRDLNERQATGGVQLAMRIGINTGEVVTASGIDREGLVTGEPVNLAARLETLAPPGGIVVGDRTQRDTRQVVAYRNLGEVSVKGFDRPIRAFQVEDELRPASRPSGGTFARAHLAWGPGQVAPMVGRDAELELLRLILDRTEREGRPTLATVVGPAGIGKSRLAYEFQLRAISRPRPAIVVRGRCLPYGDGLTYWPLAEILKGDAGIMDSDPLESIVAKARDHLVGRLQADDPESTVRVLMASVGVPVNPDPIAGAPPQVARELIARCWRAYFESIGQNKAVVVVIEDLHWADPSLLDLLEVLASRVSGGILFLAMARPDLWERRASWGASVGSATRIELSPLRTAESEDLVRHLLGDASIPPEALTPILGRAEGNPFFSQELLRMLIEEGYLVSASGAGAEEQVWNLERSLPAALPDTVQGVIASRIDLLSPGEKRTIQDAAVVGRIFWEGALDALGATPGGANLDSLIEKGLIWEREGSAFEGERELIFNHILTRDVAYQSIPRARRAVVHADALAWVEAMTRGREEEFAEILAYHAENAGDGARTARYAMLAGHRSARVFAADEAIRWYGRALEASESIPAEERADLVAEIALSRGEALEQLGKFPEAEPDYRRAIDAASEGADPLLVARGLSSLAHVLWLMDRYEEAQAVLPDALERARAAGATNVLAKLLYTAGTIQFGRGDFTRALAFHQEALAEAQAAGDLEGEAWARHGLCETHLFLGPHDRMLEEGLEADRLLRSIGQRPMAYHNLYMVAYAHATLGRFEEARAAAEASIVGNRELGNRRDETFAVGSRALVALLAGDLGQAIEAVEESEALAQTIEAPRLLFATQALHASVLQQLDDRERARPDVQKAMAISDQLGTLFYRPTILALDGWIRARDGDRDGAKRRFEEARRLEAGPFQTIQAAWIEALTWDDAGDADALEVASNVILEQSGPDGVVFGCWGRYGLASAAALRGDPDAVTILREVRAVAERFPARMVQWQAAAREAVLLETTGRADEARSARAAAAHIIRWILDRIRDPDLAAAFGRRPRAEAILAATRPAI